MHNSGILLWDTQTAVAEVHTEAATGLEFCIEQFISHSFLVHSYFTPLHSYNSSEAKEHLSDKSSCEGHTTGTKRSFSLCYPRQDMEPAQFKLILKD